MNKEMNSIEHARKVLYIKGFLTESENEKVKKRIVKYMKKGN